MPTSNKTSIDYPAEIRQLKAALKRVEAKNIELRSQLRATTDALNVASDALKKLSAQLSTAIALSGASKEQVEAIASAAISVRVAGEVALAFNFIAS